VRAPGAEVRIFYDEPRAVIRTGEALMTTTGRTYVIVGAERQRRGKRVGAWRLRCVVSDDPPPPGVRIHPLVWHRRTRKS
jgi:hypothetical protein